MTLADRFWCKVDKRGEDDCWPWIGANNGKEMRGVIWFEGKRHKAPRISLLLAGFNLNDDEKALHTCDNANCVNPKHLYVGTQSQNVQDSINRKRHIAPKGEKSGAAKLTASQVKDIRRRCDAGEQKKAMAEEFGLSYSALKSIAYRKTWIGVEYE